MDKHVIKVMICDEDAELLEDMIIVLKSETLVTAACRIKEVLENRFHIEEN